MPVFLSPDMAADAAAVATEAREERLLDADAKPADLATTLLPRVVMLEALFARIWQRAQPHGDAGEMESPDAMAVECLMREALARALEGRAGLSRRLERLSSTRTSTREELFKRLARAEDRMRGEFAWPLSLADLAKTARMSPFHFARRFAEFYGRPPHRFLAELRLEKARELLRASDQSVEEIARACGFNSVPTFTRTFKQAFGQTPGAARTRNDEGYFESAKPQSRSSPNTATAPWSS